MNLPESAPHELPPLPPVDREGSLPWKHDAKIDGQYFSWAAEAGLQSALLHPLPEFPVKGVLLLGWNEGEAPGTLGLFLTAFSASHGALLREWQTRQQMLDAQQKGRRAETALQILMEELPQALVVVRAQDGRVAETSLSCERMLGYSSAELHAMRAGRLAHRAGSGGGRAGGVRKRADQRKRRAHALPARRRSVSRRDARDPAARRAGGGIPRSAGDDLRPHLQPRRAARGAPPAAPGGARVDGRLVCARDPQPAQQPFAPARGDAHALRPAAGSRRPRRRGQIRVRPADGNFAPDAGLRARAGFSSRPDRHDRAGAAGAGADAARDRTRRGQSHVLRAGGSAARDGRPALDRAGDPQSDRQRRQGDARRRAPGRESAAFGARKRRPGGGSARGRYRPGAAAAGARETLPAVRHHPCRRARAGAGALAPHSGCAPRRAARRNLPGERNGLPRVPPRGDGTTT